MSQIIGLGGFSGSGKSTLINRTLKPFLSQKFYRSLEDPLPFDAIEGAEYIDKIDRPHSTEQPSHVCECVLRYKESIRGTSGVESQRV